MSRLPRLLLIWAALGLFVCGLAQAQPGDGIVRPSHEPSTPSLQLGAQLYAGNCASCHGIAGSGITVPRPGQGGVPGAGPSLRGVGALAADFYLRKGYMPLSSIHDQPYAEHVKFTEPELRSLITYVASLGAGPPIPQPDPASGNIARGQHLYTEHCSGCHQQMARGGYVTGARVPPLQSVSATEIAEAVRIGPYLMPKFSARQIPDRELNDIIKYVISTRRPDNRGGWGIGNLGPIPEGLVTWWIGVPLLIIGCLAVSRRMHRE